ncbi:MAG: helix-turn-helix transcriptional regulator [Bacteroidota bacterium]
MEFGERLTAIRKEKKMSQGDLAKMVGIHANVLGRYERGEARPFVEMAVKLAEALSVSTDYLLGNTDADLDTDTLKRLTEINLLPEEDKKEVFRVIDSLILGYKAQELGLVK